MVEYFLVRRQKDDMQVNVAGFRRNIKNMAHNYSAAQVTTCIFIRYIVDKLIQENVSEKLL